MELWHVGIEFQFYKIQLSDAFYLYCNGVVGKFNQCLGTIPLSQGSVKVWVRSVEVGYILPGFGRGHLGTQVVTETSLLSAPVAVLVLYFSPLLCSLLGVHPSEILFLVPCTDTAPGSPTQGA